MEELRKIWKKPQLGQLASRLLSSSVVYFVKLSISGIHIINGRWMNMSMAHLWNHKDRDKLKDLDKKPPCTISWIKPWISQIISKYTKTNHLEFISNKQKAENRIHDWELLVSPSDNLHCGKPRICVSGELTHKDKQLRFCAQAFLKVLANTAGKMVAQANDCRKGIANQT
jgi:hypothetical protein